MTFQIIAMSVEKELLRNCQCLAEYKEIVDTCMVSFITDEVFDVLPEAVGKELLGASDDLIASLPSYLFRKTVINLISLYNICPKFTLSCIWQTECLVTGSLDNVRPI